MADPNKAQMDDSELSAALGEESGEDNADDSEILPDEEKGQIGTDAGKSPAEARAGAIPNKATETKPITLDDLQAQFAKLSEQVKAKDQMIGRQANEIGQLRKAKKEVPPPPTDDEFFKDPVTATRKLNEHDKAKQEMTAEDANAKILEQVENTRATVTGYVNDFDILLPDIEKVLVEGDKLDPNMVRQFISNPFGTDPVALIQMAQRAKERKALTSLQSENEELKKQIETLKKKPGKILESLEKASKAGPSVSAKTGRASGKLSSAYAGAAQRAVMSDEELTTALNE